MSGQLERRPLGASGLEVSILGLGTVTLGRRTRVDYLRPARIPDAREAAALLDRANECGVNLLDTAPAYGDAEVRLGRLLRGRREHWALATKTGEIFGPRRSVYDFSPEHTRASVERSLRRLGTDWLDLVLVHSDGHDFDILQRFGTLDALAALKAAGKLRAFGISTKSLAGGHAAVKHCDALMVTLNRAAPEAGAVAAEAAAHGCGVLVKKPLARGHLPAEEALPWAAAQAGVTSVVVGTSDPAHLVTNVRALTGGL